MVHTLLQDVVANATNKSFNSYFSTKKANKTGLQGNWFNFGDLHIYRSTTRDMARFGLLILNNGYWENTQIINESFFNEMTTTSQNINKSYGYLWWLNGQTNYMLPSTQVVFNGSMIPNALNDMIMALGASDQKIYIVPSNNLIVIRMGDTAGENNYSLSSFEL